MIEFQFQLSPELPPISGNADYAQLLELFTDVDELLTRSQVEQLFIQTALKDRKPTPKRLLRLKRALRCTIARSLLNRSYRQFAAELACNHLLQRFCQLIEIDRIEIPSRGRLESYEKLVDAESIREWVNELNRKAAEPIEPGLVHEFGLPEALDLSIQFIDTTCLKANIHHPIDWLLFRDTTRTLMLGVERIRKGGLKERMRPPKEFQRQMNQLCIQMTHARRKAGSKRERKRILRRMKKLLKKVAGHAQRHLDLLKKEGTDAGFHRAECLQIQAGIEGILRQVPQVITQAHERIIGERQVPNEEKILSVYDPDIHVIKRGKAGANVEFGNTLKLCEQADGLITHWQLFQETAPADVKLVEPTVEQLKKTPGTTLDELVGDRGFDSRSNQRFLKAEEITNRICPRSPTELADRLTDPDFRDRQKRRAQTEARISILFGKFFGRPMRKKGFKNRDRQVAWCILAHNLWKLARILSAERLAQAA